MPAFPANPFSFACSREVLLMAGGGGGMGAGWMSIQLTQLHSRPQPQGQVATSCPTSLEVTKILSPIKSGNNNNNNNT